MIKDNYTEDDYNDLEITDPIIASELFRNYMTEKMEDKKVAIDYVKYYSHLSEPCQKVVNHVITCLLPDVKRDFNLGGYFKELLNDRALSQSHLASLLASKRDCEFKLGINGDFFGKDDIKSKIQWYLKAVECKERGQDLIEEICGLFNVDFNAITTGIGIEYQVNYDAVGNLLKSKNEDEKLFSDRFCKSYFKCLSCVHQDSCVFKENYMNYMDMNERNKAECICKILNVPLEDILIESRICIDIEGFSFEKQFNRLKKAERDAVGQMIVDLLALKDIT